jgi:hypothetical protein
MKIKFKLNDGKEKTIGEDQLVRRNKRSIVVNLSYRKKRIRYVGGAILVGSQVHRYKGSPETYRDSGTKEVKLNIVKNSVKFI